MTIDALDASYAPEPELFYEPEPEAEQVCAPGPGPEAYYAPAEGRGSSSPVAPHIPASPLPSAPASKDDAEELSEAWKDKETDWADLTEAVRTGWAGLGFTETTWDDSDPPACNDLGWGQLSAAQLAGATALGYTEETWMADVGDTFES